MRDAETLAEDYLALWNETNAARRTEILARTWSPNATYRDPMMSGNGHGEINNLIAGVHTKFPDFKFSLMKAAESVGDNVRFSWGLGPQSGEALIVGTDFVVRDGDRIARVVGFLDRMPANA